MLPLAVEKNEKVALVLAQENADILRLYYWFLRGETSTVVA